MEPVILIEKLAPFSKYFVSVRANTRLGDGGQDSVLLLVYTLEDGKQGYKHFAYTAARKSTKIFYKN